MRRARLRETGTPDREGAAGSGQALAPATRRTMEDAFGASLADVRVHTDGVTGTAARHRRAAAFTVGPDIGFAPGRYAPGTATGQHLLAHELAHVLQQRRGGPAASTASTGALEQQAGRAAQEVAAGGRLRTPLSAAPTAAQHSSGDEAAHPIVSKPAVKIAIPLRKLKKDEKPGENETIKTKWGDVTLKVSVGLRGAGKDSSVPTQAVPNVEGEYSIVKRQWTAKIKTDVLKFSPDGLESRLGALGFIGKFEVEGPEAELDLRKGASLSLVKVKFKGGVTYNHQLSPYS